MSYTKNGWPTPRNAVTEPVKGYFDARSELSVSNDRCKSSSVNDGKTNENQLTSIAEETSSAMAKSSSC